MAIKIVISDPDPGGHGAAVRGKILEKCPLADTTPNAIEFSSVYLEPTVAAYIAAQDAVDIFVRAQALYNIADCRNAGDVAYRWNKSGIVYSHGSNSHHRLYELATPTTTTAQINPGATTIPVVSTEGYGESGEAFLNGNDNYAWTGKTPTSFTGVTGVTNTWDIGTQCKTYGNTRLDIICAVGAGDSSGNKCSYGPSLNCFVDEPGPTYEESWSTGYMAGYIAQLMLDHAGWTFWDALLALLQNAKSTEADGHWVEDGGYGLVDDEIYELARLTAHPSKLFSPTLVMVDTSWKNRIRLGWRDPCFPNTLNKEVVFALFSNEPNYGDTPAESQIILKSGVSLLGRNHNFDLRHGKSGSYWLGVYTRGSWSSLEFFDKFPLALECTETDPPGDQMKLWNLIPRPEKMLDSDDVLKRYIETMDYGELDEAQQLKVDLSHMWDIPICNPQFLPYIAAELGIEIPLSETSLSRVCYPGDSKIYVDNGEVLPSSGEGYLGREQISWSSIVNNDELVGDSWRRFTEQAGTPLTTMQTIAVQRRIIENAIYVYKKKGGADAFRFVLYNLLGYQCTIAATTGTHAILIANRLAHRSTDMGDNDLLNTIGTTGDRVSYAYNNFYVNPIPVITITNWDEDNGKKQVIEYLVGAYLGRGIVDYSELGGWPFFG